MCVLSSFLTKTNAAFLFYVLFSSQTSADVEDFVLQKLRKATEQVQPYLIFVRHPTSLKVARTFLVLDTKPVQLASCPTIKAIDWLVQAYFVFNARYPLGWRSAFHFIATCFYCIFEEKKGSRSKRPVADAVTPSEVELWNIINAP